MNKRDLILNLLDSNAKPEMIPAAFFLHFDSAHHTGQAAVDKHLEYFNYTDMDLIKIQLELPFPLQPQILQPEDWKTKLPFFTIEHYEPMLKVVESLVKAAQKEAVIVLTLYSPFMECNNMVGADVVARHIEQDPELFKFGIEQMTESLLGFVRACTRLGLDGFYTSTQGGEKARLSDPVLFDKYIAPSDLLLMNEVSQTCNFNILHVCDYWGAYSDLTRFANWPGQVVSAGLELTDDKELTSRQVASLFNRPFLGGLERKGVISTGTPEEIRQAVQAVLQNAPERFILGADCTVLTNTPWDNLRLAIQIAHEYLR